MKNTRVLVIDDDLFLQAVLDKQLRGIGLPAPDCADNGVHALALIAASEPFDVIFCDVFMPEMDGIEFLRKSNYSGPIVMMSGQSEAMLDGAARIGESGGANIVAKIVKPFTAEDIKAVLLKAGVDLV